MNKLSKIDESVWADMHRRSNGDIIRKEDEIGNLHKLEPVDMGGSILWADRDFQIDGNFWFTYKDAEESLQGTDWRLPTREEAEELFYLFNSDHFSKEGVKYIFTNNDTSLVFINLGIKYGDNEKIIKPNDYHCWTSTISSPTNQTHYKLSLEPSGISSAKFYCSYPMHDYNGLCVRPVKDKH